MPILSFVFYLKEAMGKLLESLIAKEIEEALSILKKKKIIKEAGSIEDDLLAGLAGDGPTSDDPSVNPPGGATPDVSGGDVGGADPNAEIPADPSADPDAAGEENPTDTPEEEKDPIDAAFDDIKDLSDKTEDITKIVKAIKAKLQDEFSSHEEVVQLISKIESDGTPLMKKALARPELRFAKIQSI